MADIFTDTNGAQPVVQGPDGPVAFQVQTDVTYAGTPLNLMRRGLGKRARASNLNECLNTCAQSSECVGTSYTESTSECNFFSGISGQPMSAPGTDFAKVTSRDGMPVNGGASNGTSSMVSMSRSAGFSSTLYGNSSTKAPMSRTSSVQVSGSATGSAGSASRSATRASGSGSSAAASATSTPSLITFDGVLFKLEINITYTGIFLDIEIDLAKRAGQTLDDCLGACAGNSSCVGKSSEHNSQSRLF